MKVIIAKLGLDGHDRGAVFISRYLISNGVDVTYTGIRKTPKDVAAIALHINPDLIGVSLLSGAHKELITKLMDELKNYNLKIKVIAGGIIPKNDFSYLKSIGVYSIFTPGTSMSKIMEEINKL